MSGGQPDTSTAIELLAAFDPLAGAGDGAGVGDERAGAERARYVLLDVFTDRPLEGNQLAVFPDARGVAEEDMQRLARELKLSETVFVLPALDGGDAAIRIFTPRAELPFAGHPVLGTAVVVARALARDTVALETGMGAVTVRVRREQGPVASGWMGQPIPSWSTFERQSELLAALGVERSELPVEVYDNGPRHVYVALASPAAVAALAPDLRSLVALGGVNVSCFAGSGRHWKTRMFAPGLGVPEDPATGSAAGPLAVHLARHGVIDFGAEIEISQGREIDRPSLLYAFAGGSGDAVSEVQVGGSAVIVAAGEFLLG